jgi:hypothetical protein
MCRAPRHHERELGRPKAIEKGPVDIENGSRICKTDLQLFEKFNDPVAVYEFDWNHPIPPCLLLSRR